MTTRDPTGTKELGVLVDRPAHKTLMIQPGSDGAPEWILGVAPPGTPAYLITRETYDVVHASSANDDGSITHGGKRYRLQPLDSSGAHIADLAPA